MSSVEGYESSADKVLAEENGDIESSEIKIEPEQNPEAIRRAIRAYKMTAAFLGLFAIGQPVRHEMAERVFDHAHANSIEAAENASQKFQELRGVYGDLVYGKWAPSSIGSERANFINKWPLVSLEKFEGDIHTQEEELEPQIDIKISDFENADFYTEADALKQKLKLGVPSGWLEDVSSVSQVDSTISNKDKYGLPSHWKTLASARREETGKTSIEFYKITKLYSSKENMETLFHEVAHANDWERDLRMSAEDRVVLLYQITKRLESRTRFKSQYVEAINNKDKRMEKYLKAVEYWAEISSQYFSNPDSLHADDFMIVDTHIRRTNPNFKNHLIKSMVL